MRFPRVRSSHRRRWSVGVVLGLLATFVLQIASPVASQAAAGGSTLSAGQTLTVGQSLVDGKFKLVLGSDGNLVLDQTAPGYGNRTFPIWATGTPGHANARLVMQTDGNLVLYSSTGAAYWNTQTAGHSGAGIYVILGSDGQISVQTSRQVFWQSRTSGDPNGNDKVFPGQSLTSIAPAYFSYYGSGPDRRYSNNGTRVILEHNGFFSLFPAQNGNIIPGHQNAPPGHICPINPNIPVGSLWSVGHGNFASSVLKMQTDTNLVDYGAPNSTYVVWSANPGTSGNVGAYLKVQDDGNIVIYSNWGRAVWASNTVGANAPYTPTC